MLYCRGYRALFEALGFFSRHYRLLLLYALGFLALSLISCSPKGDFGRPRMGYTEKTILPIAGNLKAKALGEQASFYALTTNEKELRNRAWNFLMPDIDTNFYDWEKDNLSFYKIIPRREPDVSLFYRTLVGGDGIGGMVASNPLARRIVNPQDSFVSLSSRYNKVRDAILSDQALLPDFIEVAHQVLNMDDARRLIISRSKDIKGEEKSSSMGRMCENAEIITRVHLSFYDRAAQYRYALEHLIFEGAEQEVIPAERALLNFEAYISYLPKVHISDSDCSLEKIEISVPPPAIKPRPIVRKG